MSANFGNVKVSSTSARAITVKNTGTSDLVISNINITGSNASEFSQTNDCTTIPAGGSCTITGTFNPTLPFGKKTATVSILSNDPKKPTVNVKISGNAPPAKISVSPTSVNFGNVNLGSTSGKTITVKNTGTSDLVISNINITGSNASEFSQTNDCTTIPAGGSCTITGTFTPTSIGIKSATMSISSNDPKKPTVDVKLSGKAEAAGPTLYAPHNVRYTLTGSSLAIQWDVSLNAKGYKVGMGTESGVYDKLYDVGDNTTFGPLDISGFLPATLYLAVKAYNQSSVSLYSEEIAVKVVAGNLSINPTNVVGGATGTYTSKTSGSTVNFSVTPFASDGSVTASMSLGQDVLSIRTDSTMAAITWKGVTIDGFGALTPAEEQAIESLAQSGLAEALAMIPLDASCGTVDLDLAAAQALLLPWHLILKYTSCDPAADARAMGEKSACSYFNNLDTTKMPKYIFMSKNDPIPYVLGSTPFDEIGAASSDPTKCPKISSGLGFSSLFAQDQTGLETDHGITVSPSPCDSKCRGACGIDCAMANCGDPVPIVECDPTSNSLTLYYDYTCWVNDGCQAHDDCYDECNRKYYCTSNFANFICHHRFPDGCDYTNCIYTYGLYQCNRWRQGLDGDKGPNAQKYHFSHLRSEHYAPCTPQPPPPITFSISAVIAGTGSGTISANPPGFGYPVGTVVTLTENPASGSCFKGWGGVCFDFGTNATCRLTMNGDKTVSANFDTCAMCTYTYSDWSPCQPDNTQTRTVISSSPPGCVGTPVLSQPCTYVPPTCTYTYSDWSACQPNNTQTRTVISSSPPGCVGTPVLSQACTYVPPTCTYSISPTSQPFGPDGGTGNLTVNAPNGCPWTAASNASWIAITSGSSGKGDGTVNYAVAANSGASQRVGTMTLAGKTFTVTQEGKSSCTYSISPTSNTFSSTGGAGGVGVTASSGCNWTATSNASWIAITSGSSGKGNGTVNYAVAANSGASQRVGTMTIAGKTFTVTQSGSSSNPFHGSVHGNWSGTCTGGWPVGGTFDITIGSNGAVTGTYAGDDSGTITGSVDTNGNYSASGGAGDASWSGSFSVSGTTLSGSGSWSEPSFGCSGTWSGTGTATH
jgi:hypothetical protein